MFVPPETASTLQGGSRVGVLIGADDTPTHSHIGTTVFNNFEKPYPGQWAIGAKLRTAMTEALRGRGFEVVDLAASGFRPEEVTGLVVSKSRAWTIEPAKQATQSRLRQLGLQAVIVTTPLERHVVNLECSQFGCVERHAEGMGLYTRSFLGIDRYAAVPGFDFHVYVLDAPADLASYGQLRSYSTIAGRIINLTDYASPADHKNLTEAELAPVRTAIEQRIAELSAAAASALNPNAPSRAVARAPRTDAAPIAAGSTHGSGTDAAVTQFITTSYTPLAADIQAGSGHYLEALFDHLRVEPARRPGAFRELYQLFTRHPDKVAFAEATVRHFLPAAAP